MKFGVKEALYSINFYNIVVQASIKPLNTVFVENVIILLPYKRTVHSEPRKPFIHGFSIHYRTQQLRNSFMHKNIETT